MFSCANLPDVPVCFELDVSEGYCAWTVSNKSQYVNDTVLLDGATWFDLRPSMVLVPAKSWTELKKATMKFCAKYPKHCKNSNVEKKLEEIKP